MIDFIVISGSILRLGCLDCDSYIGDIVILWIVKPGFCSIHYTVTVVRLKNVNRHIRRISLYRRSLYRGSTVPYRSKKEGNCFPYPPRKQPTTITTTKRTETQLAIRLSHKSALPTCSRLFIYQFIYLFIYLCIYLFIYLFIYLLLFVCLFNKLFAKTTTGIVHLGQSQASASSTNHSWTSTAGRAAANVELCLCWLLKAVFYCIEGRSDWSVQSLIF